MPRLPHRVRSVISRCFHHFGIHCASHPKRVILVSSVVITSLFYPALAPYSSSNPTYALSFLSSLFDAYQSDLHEIWESHDELHILADAATRARCGMERTLRVERVLVPSSEWTPAGAATPATLQFASKLDDRIGGVLRDSKPPLSCVRTADKQCLVLSPLLLFDRGIPSTTTDVLKTINASPNMTVSDIRIGVPMLFSGRSFTDDRLNTVVEHVTFLALTYFFLEKDCLASDGHDRWLKTLETTTLDGQGSSSVTPFLFQKPRFIALRYDPTLSRPSHFSAISLLLYMSYLGVFLSFSGSLRRMDTVHSRFGLTFTALVEIVASTIGSVSVCALAGFRITMVPWGILPVIIVFVGAENMFLLVDAVTSTSVTLSVKQRIGTGLAVAGTSNTLNTVSYNAILGVIAFFATGAIRQFCSFAIVLLVAHWFLIHTFFVAVLSIDLQRLELSDMLTQDKASKPTVPPIAPISLNEPPPSKRRQTMNRIQERLRVVPAKNGSLVLMLAVTVTLYYVTYPFPNHPKAETDPLAFLQHAMRRAPPAVEDISSPALNLWNTLNPEHDPLVNIRIERPMVVAHSVQGSSIPRRDAHRQDIRPHEPMARRAFWLLKIVILPIGTTTGCLYLLLLYLLKDTDLLEVQRNRPEDSPEDFADATASPVGGNVAFTTLPRGFATDVEFIATNHDASVVAIVSAENELLIWNGQYQKLDVWAGFPPGSSTSGALLCITCIAVDFSGQYCAVGTNSGVVCIWNIALGKYSVDTEPRSFSVTLPASIADLAFVSVDRRRSQENLSHAGIHLQPPEEGFCIVATCDNGTAFHTDPRFATAIHSIQPSHTDSVLRAHLLRTADHDSAHVAYTYYDGTAELFSPADNYSWESICLVQPGSHVDPVTELCLNSIKVDGSYGVVLGVATTAGVVSLWDPAKGECISLLDNAFGAVTRLRIAPMLSQPCQRCGEFTPDAFILTFSVGHTVFVHRASLSSMTKRCTCPVARKVVLTRGETFGRRSRSSSTTSESSSPSRTRLKLPAITSLPPADVSAFPVSGHGVHSRRAGAEKDINRRASETLSTIQSEPERSDVFSQRPLSILKGLPSVTAGASSPWRSLVLDQLTDISCERGGWDLIDGHQLIGLRRRSRLGQNGMHKPDCLRHPVPVGRGELTSSVLERWELWTFNPTKPDAGVRVSSLLALTRTSSPSTKGSLYPRLPFTRVHPMVVRPSACVAGFGNTAGIINLSYQS
ncbi:sterol-sensing domain of SREBP cleavage-activation-domain-containing protein [Gautieria morchelliformis]|nr:sterol-sensing domain of SREBP cleavage-activation-domain-containing protein [Gautieria morchelliformis]